MIVHVPATHPSNGQPKSAPLLGLCGKEIAGLYMRRADRSSKTICPECRAALARTGNGEGRASDQDAADSEAASG